MISADIFLIHIFKNIFITINQKMSHELHGRHGAHDVVNAKKNIHNFKQMTTAYVRS